MYRNYITQLDQQKGGKQQGKMAGQVEETQQQLWEKLNKGESKSLLKKHLTPELYEQLKDKKTGLGGTIGDCIRSGRENYFVVAKSVLYSFARLSNFCK